MGWKGWKSVVVPVVVHRITYAGGGLSWGWVLGSTGLEAGCSSSYCWQNMYADRRGGHLFLVLLGTRSENQ